MAAEALESTSSPRDPTVQDFVAEEFVALPGRSPVPPRKPRKRKRRKLGPKQQKPLLSTDLILEWADRHHERTGDWPTPKSGTVADALWPERWSAVDSALHSGSRGLPGGSSLARLLQEYRGRRNLHALARFTVAEILAWADAHYLRTGSWPRSDSGPIPHAPGDTWQHVHVALHLGARGLPGGSSLARLLQAERGVRNRKSLPPFTEEQIGAWMLAYRTREGKWPGAKSGPIPEAPGETWAAVSSALGNGIRGLPGGSSLRALASLLAASHLRDDNADPRPPRLTVEQILGWADLHFERTGQWPGVDTGVVIEAPRETWRGLDKALRVGWRGLPGGSSVAALLGERRGASNRRRLPPLAVEEILRWADAHRARTGEWPHSDSGPILESTGETWSRVHSALVTGSRGLPEGGSLARLLLAERGVEHHLARPPLSEELILSWMDAYHARYGRWPTHESGVVEGASGERWNLIDNALRAGLRGLPGGSSVARLLAAHRGKRLASDLPALSIDRILAWADTHFERHGAYPQETTGAVEAAPRETWRGINHALRLGRRGLPGGSSLARLLAEKRGCDYRRREVALTEAAILAWADAFRIRHGRWPDQHSGPVRDAPGETWIAVSEALREGRRGLPGGSSLAKLLQERRGRRNVQALPRFTEAEILTWADEHHRRTGSWPRKDSGPVAEAPGESWRNVDAALRVGVRGLPGGSSLARLLQECRGVRNRKALPPYTDQQIREWMLAHREREGRWPAPKSGPIAEAPGETWAAVDSALRAGIRGLPGGSSLAQVAQAIDSGPG